MILGYDNRTAAIISERQAERQRRLDMKLGVDNRMATNISEWLEIATVTIAAVGKERICREIWAHYADAVAAHVERGESGEVAQAKALEELGEPQKAAEKFQHEYVTEKDEKLMKRISRTAREPWKSVSVAMCFIVLPIYVVFSSMLQTRWVWTVVLFSTAWLTTCVVIPRISFVRAGRSSFEDGIRLVVRLEYWRWYILGWISYLAGEMAMRLHGGDFLFLQLLSGPVFICALIVASKVGRLDGKLRRIRGAAGKTPTAA